MTKSAVYPAINSPTIKDIYWIAGFMEGEAYFGGAIGHIVTVTQKDIEPLTKLQDLLGGSIHPAKDNHVDYDYWRWQACGPRAKGIMMTLYPLLSERRQEAIREALCG